MAEKLGTSTTTSGGIGFTGALTITFIVLKLVGVVSWSWWWVLSPLWISTLLALAVLAIVAVVVWVLDARDRRARERLRERAARRRAGQPLENEHGPAHRWGRRRGSGDG